MTKNIGYPDELNKFYRTVANFSIDFAIVGSEGRNFETFKCLLNEYSPDIIYTQKGFKLRVYITDTKPINLNVPTEHIVTAVMLVNQNFGVCLFLNVVSSYLAKTLSCFQVYRFLNKRGCD